MSGIKTVPRPVDEERQLEKPCHLLINNKWREFIELYDTKIDIKLDLTKQFLVYLYDVPEDDYYKRHYVKRHIDKKMQSKEKAKLLKRRDFEEVNMDAKLQSVGEFLNKYCYDLVPNIYENSTETSFPTKFDDGIAYSEFDLFLWAIVTQKMEIAKYFWRNGKDHISSAIVASSISNLLAKKALRKGDMKMLRRFEKQEREFRELATGIFQVAALKDKYHSKFLLLRAIPCWNRNSCMEIAYKFHFLPISDNRMFQLICSELWYGELSLNKKSLMPIIGNLLFAFATTKRILFQSKKDKEPKKKDEDAFENFKRNNIDYDRPKTWSKMLSIYYNAPITKFMMFLASYFIFLACFTYLCLIELKSFNAGVQTSDRKMEFIVYSYSLGLLMELIRQKIKLYNSNRHRTLKRIFMKINGTFWDFFDIVICIIFVLAIIFRNTNLDFIYAKTLFAFVLFLFVLRFLQFFYVHTVLGPTVILIRKLLAVNVVIFILYFVGLYSYGSLQQALLYPNSNLNATLLYNIFNIPYWQLFGSIDLSIITGKISQNGVNPNPNSLVTASCAVYLVFTNIILLNILIAIFNFKFDKFKKEIKYLWMRGRIDITQEYMSKPILPPPLNIFEIIFLVFKQRVDITERNRFRINLNKSEDKRSSGFEEMCMKDYLKQNPLFSKDYSARMYNIKKNIEKIKEMLYQCHEKELMKRKGNLNHESSDRSYLQSIFDCIKNENNLFSEDCKTLLKSKNEDIEFVSNTEKKIKLIFEMFQKLEKYEFFKNLEMILLENDEIKENSYLDIPTEIDNLVIKLLEYKELVKKENIENDDLNKIDTLHEKIVKLNGESRNLKPHSLLFYFNTNDFDVYQNMEECLNELKEILKNFVKLKNGKEIKSKQDQIESLAKELQRCNKIEIKFSHKTSKIGLLFSFKDDEKTYYLNGKCFMKHIQIFPDKKSELIDLIRNDLKKL